MKYQLLFVLCTQDHAIPPGMQRKMIDQILKPGNTDVEVYNLDASHSPFLSMPKTMADVIRKADGEYVDGMVFGR